MTVHTHSERALTREFRWLRYLGLALLLVPLMSLAEEDNAGSVLVQLARVQRQEIAATVRGFGQVQPDPDSVISITLPRPGLVSRLWVRPGQRVQAGVPLLELDTAPTARMDYQQAEAAVTYARSDVERLRRLLTQQLATREQVASAERALRDAEARLQAQHKLGTDKPVQVIRAPHAGVVTRVEVSQGQRVQGDTTALLLSSRDALVVPLGIEQEEAARVAPGMAVKLVSVFRPEVHISAAVDQVHAMVDPKTRLVDVMVRVPKATAGGLLLSETMRGEITLARHEGLTVPRSAVLSDAQGNYVFLVRDGRARRVDVTPGLTQDGRVEVEGGLHAGDAVVTVGNYELSDGMAVREAAP